MLRSKYRVRLAVYSVLLFLMLQPCILSSLSEEKFRITLVSPSSVYPNDIVHLQGTGAVPRALVVAYIDGRMSGTYIVSNTTSPWTVVGLGNVTVGSAVADELGSWDLDFRTPLALPGRYSLCAFDNSSLSSDVVDFEVLMNVTYPWNSTLVPVQIANMTFHVLGTVVPSSGPSGTLVTMSGPSASVGEITVYFDDLIVARVESQTESCNIMFTVPNASAGSHTVRAVAALGRWMSTATFQVTTSIVNLPVALLLLLGLFALALLSALIFFVLFASFLRRRKLRLSVRSSV